MQIFEKLFIVKMAFFFFFHDPQFFTWPQVSQVLFLQTKLWGSGGRLHYAWHWCAPVKAYSFHSHKMNNKWCDHILHLSGEVLMEILFQTKRSVRLWPHVLATTTQISIININWVTENCLFVSKYGSCWTQLQCSKPNSTKLVNV